MPNTDLLPAIDAPRRVFHTRSQIALNYYVDDEASGVPLVLIHSINAAPSAMEVKPIFEHYRGSRPVYALELPGFGFSQRGPQDYSPGLFTRCIAEFCDSLTVPALDIVVLSLSSEFAARAVVEGQLGNCRSLVLVSPTGFGRREPPSPKVGARILAVLQTPWLGNALWRSLISRRSIRFYSDKGFHGTAPQELVDYAWHTAHQADAHHAPFAFLSMVLFTTGALGELYRRLPVPTLVLYDRDPNIDFERLPEAESANPHVMSERIADTCGLPHWERPATTWESLDRFWSGLPDSVDALQGSGVHG